MKLRVGDTVQVIAGSEKARLAKFLQLKVIELSLKVSRR